MLSRLAESLFWIGRYVERAEDTARILDVQLHRLLEDPWADEDESCRSLLSVMGVEELPERPVTRHDLLEILALGDGPGSVMTSLGEARENARRAREIVSNAVWEALNTTFNTARGWSRAGRPAETLMSWVVERAAVVAGYTDNTMPRDLAWNFLVAGRSLERADMSARFIAAGDSDPGLSWNLLLRSAGAYESYLRFSGGVPAENGAAEFLLRDPLFPRSVAFALESAERRIGALGGGIRMRRGEDDPVRMVGRARAQLEYTPIREVLSDLGEMMDQVQLACALASGAVAREYFPRDVATEWITEEVS